MKSYLEKHRRAFGLIGAVLALAVAIIYLVVIPKESSDASGIQKVVLAYGHSLCWFLLSGASYLWSTNKKNRWPATLAYAALASYVIFMGTLLITKSS